MRITTEYPREVYLVLKELQRVGSSTRCRPRSKPDFAITRVVSLLSRRSVSQAVFARGTFFPLSRWYWALGQ